MTTSTLGSPAFTLEGKVLGVFVMRSLKKQWCQPGHVELAGGQSHRYHHPGEDILKAARQAPAVAPQEKAELDPEKTAKRLPLVIS